MKKQLTRKDAVALWHAVDNFKAMVQAIPGIEGIDADTLARERQRLDASRVALRKVQAIVREGRKVGTRED